MERQRSGITGSDVQVLNSNGQTGDTLTATAPELVVTGLTNGSGYRLRVRARNVQGPGEWTTGGDITPQTVPGEAALAHIVGDGPTVVPKRCKPENEALAILARTWAHLMWVV